jgi:hypothetical protein
MLIVIVPSLGASGWWQQRLCKGREALAEQQYDTVKHQFLTMQRVIGIVTPVETLQQKQSVSGVQASVEEINKTRRELNLLLQGRLTAPAIERIRKKIIALKKLNPERWPRSSDYRDLLERKIAIAQRSTSLKNIHLLEQLEQRGRECFKQYATAMENVFKTYDQLAAMNIPVKIQPSFLHDIQSGSEQVAQKAQHVAQRQGVDMGG